MIKPGTVANDIVGGHDWLPTLVAAAGEPDIADEAAERPYGGQQDLQSAPRRLQPTAYLMGEPKESPRKEFFYFDDDGDLVGLSLCPLEARL